MKQKRKIVRIFGVVLAAVMTASTVALSACKTEVDNAFRIPKTELPAEEQFALEKYDYDDLSHVQTTMRADVTNVLARNLPRAQTTLLSNDFSIVNDTQTKELTAQYETVANS